MPQRPVPKGYYAMSVRDLLSFLVGVSEDVKLAVEIDGERFPVIKLVRAPTPDGAVVLRVPSEHR